MISTSSSNGKPCVPKINPENLSNRKTMGKKTAHYAAEYLPINTFTTTSNSIKQ